MSAADHSATGTLDSRDTVDTSATFDACEPSDTLEPFDARLRYRCSPNVSMRPERFGALAYHHGTRRLTFLKSALLAEVVRGLADHASAEEALHAAGVPHARRPGYRTTLATLAASGMIERHPAP